MFGRGPTVARTVWRWRIAGAINESWGRAAIGGIDGSNIF